MHNQYLILMERQEQQMGVGFTVTPLMRNRPVSRPQHKILGSVLKVIEFQSQQFSAKNRASKEALFADFEVNNCIFLE
jgi:hypothetical protein